MSSFKSTKQIRFDTRLQGPFTMIIAGPTSCGKSVLISRIIQNAQSLINPAPDDILYCYGQWQPLYEELKNHGVVFHHGLLSREELLESDRDLSKHTLLVIDDLLNPEDAPLIRDLFIKGSHHRNMSIIFVTQNLFLPHKDYRTTSINAQYMVIFNNPRDRSQIQALSHQMYPEDPTFLTRVYNHETQEEYSYILLDFKQSTPKKLRIRSSITSDNFIYAFAQVEDGPKKGKKP